MGTSGEGYSNLESTSVVVYLVSLGQRARARYYRLLQEVHLEEFPIPAVARVLETLAQQLDGVRLLCEPGAM